MTRLVLLLLSAVVSLGLPAPAHASGGDRFVLSAQTGVGNIPKAKAVYEVRQRDVRLKIEVERFKPGVKNTILLNGRVIGTITANQFGRAEVNFRGRSDDRNVQGRPPVIKKGDRIQVGKLVGTFR